MFKRNKAFILLPLLALLVASAGCKKGTFDINTINPNVPSDVDPKFILSGALKNTAAAIRGGDADYIELYMGYYAVSGDYIPQTQTLTYQTSTSYYSTAWDDVYQNLKNYRQMEVLAAADPNAGYYSAMAKIMESLLFGRLVDQYNDIPYTQALQGGVINFPTYDKAANVYDSLIVKLNDAISIINTTNGNPNAEIPGAYDVMFNQGNANSVSAEMTLWKQLANTVKLRLALNMSGASGGSSYVQSALNGTSADGFLGAGADASINPGYSNSSEYQQSPYYYDMGFSTSGAVQNQESYLRACSYIVDLMYANSDTTRLNQMFAPATALGAVAGRAFGSNVSVGQDNQHVSGMGPGLLQTPSATATILPACESLFMQAEATLDGYLPGGSGAAGTLYQTAVEESFREYEVPNAKATADAYIASQSGNPYVDFAGGGQQLNTVITQEWLSVCGIDPLTSWSNWRRLGIPSTLPVSIFEASTATHIPYRQTYPVSEYSFNATNVAAEGTINILTSTIFWMP
jgi:Starch-binding associating with outer membrane